MGRPDGDDFAFPRQLARTRGFLCGRPRTPTVAPDGSRVVFLRSPSGDDPANRLWVLDLDTKTERLVYDPGQTTGRDGDALTAAERARRERARERATGVVAYATDRDVTKAVFVDGGRLWLADLVAGSTGAVDVDGTPDDPTLDPAGARLAYVLDGALIAHELGGKPRELASDDDPDVRWGLAEFAAAEEMDRPRGYWWSPDGTRIAGCRVDERPVRVWWISDPTDPSSNPYPIRYPQAGTANASVTLHVIDVATGGRVDVRWDDSDRFEYLARVWWSERSRLTLLVQSRDQRTARILAVDERTGQTEILLEQSDPAWVHLLDGAPARLVDGRLVTWADIDDARRLVVDGRPVTPSGLDVDTVEHVGSDIVFTGIEHERPTETHAWRVSADASLQRLSLGDGIHGASAAGDLVVLTTWDADAVEPMMTVRRGDEVVATIESLAETPIVSSRPTFATVGERDLQAALVLPHGAEPDAWDRSRRLPVLLAPYGGPHFRQVQRSRGAFLAEAFYADRLGVAVLAIDGRGTPGRGMAWERSIAGDFTVTLVDQVDGLRAAAERWPILDLDRVGIIGWSFGGLLAAMAVIDRPDVFRTAVAGAPVTDQRLYDTHYTERYLGHPDERPDAYERSSPISRASELQRPLLLIHGLADDNVVAAHSLLLSSRLFSAGIHHELLLLPNASHVGGFDDLVVGRYLAVLEFLRRTLVEPSPSPS